MNIKIVGLYLLNISVLLICTFVIYDKVILQCLGEGLHVYNYVYYQTQYEFDK